MTIDRATCRRCHRPVDEQAIDMVRQTCEKRGLPQGTPTHCSECMWASVVRRGEKEDLRYE